MLANSVSPEEKRRPSALYLGPTQPIPKKSLQIRTDKPRPHVCAICTRGFARLEHLKRHERSHTNEKPFQCAACGRCFARRDLVLRHQQKLHLHMLPGIRRGLMPSVPVVEGLPPPNLENIIILRNNTNAKAPLPPGAANLAAGGNSAALSPSHVGASPHDFSMDKIKLSFSYLLALQATMPLPNTVLSHNTPLAPSGKPGLRSDSADLGRANGSQVSGSASVFTQQPSPLTGDSPDLKEKRKYPWPAPIADEITSQQPRHASFLAVLGMSYTNLKDALSIQSHQIPDAPAQVGFSTPQLTAAEFDSKGLSTMDFGLLDMDWYNLDLNDPKNGDAVGNSGGSSGANGLARNKSIKFSSVSNGTSKAKLTTIPSESHLKDMELSYFSNHVIAGHQFQDPSHPHHIKGTTPLEFSFSPTTYLEPKQSPIGTGLADLAQDIFSLENPEQQIVNGQQFPLSSQTVQAASPAHSHASLSHTQSSRRSTKRPAPMKKQSSLSSNGDSKRTKLGFVNDTDNLDWVKEIQLIPILNEFPSASHDTGFLGMPYIADNFEPDEILSLFKSRQDELVRQRSQIDTRQSPGSDRLSISATRKPSKALFIIGDLPSFVTEELRNRIILVSNLSNQQFPPMDDLNSYMDLYEKEFNSYFPFIHMPTLRNPMVDNFENIPLILAMCSIGALYSYHDNNTLLLFNLSKYHIHNFFEKEVTVDKLQFKKVPIMAHQCLVLHIFISMFLNEPNMVEITSRQMNSMVGLIKSTNFHQPLEQFLVPPPAVNSPNEVVIIQQNFDYFIMAQTRIRTILTFYQLEVLRSTLLGLSPPMSGMEIMSGTYCSNEALWKANNSSEWYAEYLKCSTVSLVDLSNNENLRSLIANMNDASFPGTSISLNKSLAVLMTIHEQILQELQKTKLDSPTGYLNWRITTRPKLENVVSSWECFFARSGGFNIVNNQNSHILRNNGELKLILPLLSYAKMRLCINITPVMKTILYKDWPGMEELLGKLETDIEGLKDATQHAQYILNLWVHNISVLNDPKKTSVRTPVFFVTCTCIAIMVLAKALSVIENLGSISVYDKALWLSTEKVLRSIETALNPSGELNSYAEFLRKQSHGVFDYAWSDEFKQNVEAVVKSLGANDSDSLAKVSKCKLSVQALSLGVRILADAPLWPLAMGFAEALKNMATQISGK